MKTTLSTILALAAVAAAPSPAFTQYTLEQVATTDKHSLYASGSILYSNGEDAIYYSTDMGYSWNTWCDDIASQLGNSKSLADACVLSPSTAVITVRSDSSDSSYVYKTTNTGQTWTMKYATEISQLAYSTRSVSGVSFTDALNGWAYGKGLILKTSNGGESWQQQFAHYESPYNSDYLTELFPVDAQRAWTSGYGASILHTSDSGDSWTYQYANDTATAGNMADDPCYYIYGIHFNSPQHGVASAAHGAYLSTSDGGQTWTPHYTGFPNDNVAAFCVDNSVIWLVGGDYCDNTGCYSGQSILYSENNGLSWNSLIASTTGPIGANNDFRDVWFFNANLGYTTRGDGSLWRIVRDVTGINEQTAGALTVVPNPADELVTVQLPGQFSASAIVLTSLHGEVVRELNAQSGPVAVDLSGLGSGVYILRAADAGGNVLQAKVVKR
jgi:photosystem II stability/assembly factor-like uncharacterized protein